MDKPAHYPYDASTDLLIRNAYELIPSTIPAALNNKPFDNPIDDFYACLNELANRGDFCEIYEILNSLTENTEMYYRNDTWELKEFLKRHEIECYLFKLIRTFILRTEYGMPEGTERRFRLQEFITGEYPKLIGPNEHGRAKSKLDIALLIEDAPPLFLEKCFLRSIDYALIAAYKDDPDAQSKRHEEIIRALESNRFVDDYQQEVEARREEHRRERRERKNQEQH